MNIRLFPLSLIFVGLFVSLCAMLLSGCQILGPENPGGEESDTPREKWESYSDGTYSFVLLRGCFCRYGGTFWVQVVDGSVVAAVNTSGNEPVPEEDLAIIETIDDIFDMIDEARTDADELDVEYSANGYPTLVMIDWIKAAVDDEMYFEISNVIPGRQQID